MKSLPVTAVAAACVIGTLVSCNSVHDPPKSPKLLSKAEVRQKKASPARRAPAPAWSSNTQSNSFLPATVDVAVKARAAHLPKDKHGRPTYTSDRIRHRVVRTTAYSHQENEPGAVGRLNAVGTTLKYGRVRSAAADWSRYPVGTTFKIKGLPHIYVVDDYGSALVGTNTVDIYHPTLGLMNKWGSRDVEINVIKWGSWERTVNLLKGRVKYPHCARMYYASLRKLSGSRVARTRPSARPAPSL